MANQEHRGLRDYFLRNGYDVRLSFHGGWKLHQGFLRVQDVNEMKYYVLTVKSTGLTDDLSLLADVDEDLNWKDKKDGRNGRRIFLRARYSSPH